MNSPSCGVKCYPIISVICIQYYSFIQVGCWLSKNKTIRPQMDAINQASLLRHKRNHLKQDEIAALLWSILDPMIPQNKEEYRAKSFMFSSCLGNKDKFQGTFLQQVSLYFLYFWRPSLLVKVRLVREILHSKRKGNRPEIGRVFETYKLKVINLYVATRRNRLPHNIVVDERMSCKRKED